ncbi:hypothetical protein [Streptomyces daliensis]|uniref:Uncharacterized protein n=1 Tax=Streptomyces daliensis TaxID=299421 RepID=A0A8T4IK51_9ACTN|nr:hypothetical protein [Streptomyces daliensis]
MTRTAQPDPSAPSTGARPRRGVTVTTFAVLRRHRGALAGTTVRVVGLCGLVGLLLTAAIFALSWPLFTHMRNQLNWYRYVEDPYLHDSSDLGLVALCTLPLFLLLLGIGSAALQGACSRAVAAGTRTPPEPPEGDPPRAEVSVSARRPWPMIAVYTLRGLIVWSLPVLVIYVSESLTGYHIDTEDQILERGSLPYNLIQDSPWVAIFIAVLLRLALALAPAAAASDGLGPVAALRRSWKLMWTRTGWIRVLALALPLAALTAGVLRLVTQLALPLRPLVRSLLEAATGNFFAGYYAGILAPVIVGILVAAALTLPLTFTAFAALHDHLRPRGAGERDAGVSAAG